MLALQIAAAVLLLGVSAALLCFVWLAAAVEPAVEAASQLQAVEPAKPSLVVDRAA